MLTSIFFASLVFAHGENLAKQIDDNTDFVQMSALPPNGDLVRAVVDAAVSKIRQGADSEECYTGCATCGNSGESACTSCDDGFNFFDSDGNGYGKCQGPDACYTGCATCGNSGESACASCDAGYYLVDSDGNGYGKCEAGATYSCDGTEQSAGEVFYFNKPFTLQMTVSTDSSEDSDGGIFEGRDGTDRVLLIWEKEGNFLLDARADSSQVNGGGTTGREFAANTNQAYLVEIAWDGSDVSWSVDGTVVGGPWALTTGFLEVTPRVCYANSGGAGGWMGTISGLSISYPA